MTFFKHISNYILVFIFFGLWSTWRNSQYTKCSKWLFQIYSITIIIGILCAYSRIILTNQIFGTSSLQLTISTISFGTIILTHLAIAIETPFKRNIQAQLIEKFTHVDETFNFGLNIIIPYREEMHKMFLHISFHILIVSFITAMIWVYSYYLGEVHDHMYFCMFSSCIMRMRLIQVLFFVCLVRSRLIFIVKELKDIKEACDVNKYETENVVDLNVFDKQTPYERLIHLKEIYGNLGEICQLINGIFGWSLLALVTQSFIDLITNGYWLFLLFDDNPYVRIDAAPLCICLILLDICVLGPLTYFCSSFSQHVSVCVGY